MKNILFLTLFTLLSSGLSTAHAQLDMFDIDELADVTEENTTSEKATETVKTTEPTNRSHTNSIDQHNNYINELSEDARKAQDNATKLFDQKPNIIELQENQKRLIEEGDEIRKQISQMSLKTKEKKGEKIVEITTEETTDNPKSEVANEPEMTPLTTSKNGSANESVIESENKVADDMANKKESISLQTKSHDNDAPFGLFWGLSKQQIEELGFFLKPAERKGYKNVYLVENPQQKSSTFDIVTAIFGEEDELWCIYAQSKPQPDNPQAENVLQLYHKYYEALEQKYGNAQQYFTPHIYTEEIESGDNNEAQTETKTIRAPMGNDNFLQELQDGTAVLYATFENEQLGITLGISVDGEGYGYISIDYKNLPIMQAEQQKKLDNILSDI